MGLVTLLLPGTPKQLEDLPLGQMLQQHKSRKHHTQKWIETDGFDEAQVAILVRKNKVNQIDRPHKAQIESEPGTSAQLGDRVLQDLDIHHLSDQKRAGHGHSEIHHQTHSESGWQEAQTDHQQNGD